MEQGNRNDKCTLKKIYEDGNKRNLQTTPYRSIIKKENLGHFMTMEVPTREVIAPPRPLPSRSLSRLLSPFPPPPSFQLTSLILLSTDIFILLLSLV